MLYPFMASERGRKEYVCDKENVLVANLPLNKFIKLWNKIKSLIRSVNTL